jgi:hypothetical protein
MLRIKSLKNYEGKTNDLEGIVNILGGGSMDYS